MPVVFVVVTGGRLSGVDPMPSDVMSAGQPEFAVPVAVAPAPVPVEGVLPAVDGVVASSANEVENPDPVDKPVAAVELPAGALVSVPLELFVNGDGLSGAGVGEVAPLVDGLKI